MALRGHIWKRPLGEVAVEKLACGWRLLALAACGETQKFDFVT
jgi:hypothetical protein